MRGSVKAPVEEEPTTTTSSTTTTTSSVPVTTTSTAPSVPAWMTDQGPLEGFPLGSVLAVALLSLVMTMCAVWVLVGIQLRRSSDDA